MTKSMNEPSILASRLAAAREELAQLRVRSASLARANADHLAANEERAVEADSRRGAEAGTGAPDKARAATAEELEIVSEELRTVVSQLREAIAALEAERRAADADRDRQAFLVRLGDALRPLADPVAIQAEAARVLGAHLGADRVMYGEVAGDDDEAFVIHRDYRREGMPSAAGRHRFDDFGGYVAGALRSGRTLVVADVRDVSEHLVHHHAAYEAVGIRAYAAVPLVKEGCIVASLAVNQAAPRAWTADEVALVEETAERTWAAVERARAEEAQRESEARFRLMADAVPQIVWITDAAGQVEFFNKLWTAYTGRPDEPTTAAEVAATAVHPDDAAITLERFDEARRTGDAFLVEHRIRSAAGEYRWFLVRGEPHRDPQTGEIARWFGASVDIHDRRVAEEALRASEAKYRTLFDSIDEGFCVVEVLFDGTGQPVDYRFEEANPAFERQTGLRDAIGKTARELVPELEAHWFETYGRVAATGEPARFVNEAQPMEGRWFDVYAFRVGGAESRRVAILFTDISVRRRTEEALRSSEERFRTLIQHSADAVQLVSPAGEILYSSDSVEAVLGYRPAEILGHNVAPYIHPDDLPTVQERLAAVAATPGGHVTVQYRVRHKDGSWAWVETTAVNHLETPNVGAIVGNFRNITARRALERQKDEFIAVATHELKTPVTSLKGYAQLLRNRFRKAGDEAAAAMMERMDGQTDRLVALIGDLLDATKIEAGQLRFVPEPIDLDALVAERVAEMRLTTERHEIRHEGSAGGPVVVDRERIGQVLTNLIANAIKYSPEGETVTVTTAEDGAGVRVCVRDRGPGIPADQQERVFERFYRAGGDGGGNYPGLGLGLYISAEFVRRHGGRIWIESVAGEGATVCFWLPQEMADAAPSEEPAGAR